ncbi:MAG: hypothetical protein JJ971_11340 [Balneolaceae bacterium]|nr:hypothetical protein [Balneolaceae bacterium]MBO6546157.1 hypothetical protein [Balneolaceae bacterium]MBO6648515.1 hypothetical protein [Balneolaceae bacterium]
MGQQQLLLVILVTIIVGIATVVAINTFSDSADSANVDAVRNDVASIAAAAQGYFIKPAMLGGGGNDFTNISFNNIAFAADSIDNSDGLTALNSNGVYVISGGNSTQFTVTAHPASRITGTPTLSSTATEGATSLTAVITEGNTNFTDNQ